MNSELSSHGQKLQEAEHAPLMCPRPQYLLYLRISTAGSVLIVNQAQPLVEPLSRVNIKLGSSGQEVGDLEGWSDGIVLGDVDG